MNRNETFSALTVATLSVRLRQTSLEILVDEVEDILVDVTGEEDVVQALNFSLTDGRLLIEQPLGGFKLRPKDALPMQVSIRVPASWKGAVNAATTSGSMLLQGFSGTDLAFTTTSGDIDASGLTGINLSLRTAFGDITAHDLAGEDCRAHTSSGNIQLTECGFTTCRFRNLIGETDVTLASPFDKLEGSTFSGPVRIIAPLDRADVFLRSLSGRVLTEGVSITPGAPRVAMRSTSANLKLICSLSMQADNIEEE